MKCKQKMYNLMIKKSNKKEKVIQKLKQSQNSFPKQTNGSKLYYA